MPLALTVKSVVGSWRPSRARAEPRRARPARDRRACSRRCASTPVARRGCRRRASGSCRARRRAVRSCGAWMRRARRSAPACRSRGRPRRSRDSTRCLTDSEPMSPPEPVTMAVGTREGYPQTRAALTHLGLAARRRSASERLDDDPETLQRSWTQRARFAQLTAEHDHMCNQDRLGTRRSRQWVLPWSRGARAALSSRQRSPSVPRTRQG